MSNFVGRKISRIKDVYDFLEFNYKDEPKEKIIVIGLDDFIVRYAKDISFNSEDNTASFSYKGLFDKLKEYNCNSFIFSHNHPTGVPIPSDIDIDLTKELISDGKKKHCDLIEHLIYSDIIMWRILGMTLKKKTLLRV